jgi:hypothetical protein
VSGIALAPPSQIRDLGGVMETDEFGRRVAGAVGRVD